MKFGYFDNDAKEYVISNPKTPLPWINYLGADEFCGLISHTAGGYCFYKDPLLRRILRYRYNNIPLDMGGRYLYVRDNETEDYWSASWQPVRKPVAQYKYECRHGLGYTKIRSEYAEIETSTLYFVPKNENNEVWVCDVTNKSGRTRQLSLFSFVEFCLFNALNDMTDYQFNLSIGQTQVDGSVIYHVTGHNFGWTDVFAYFACNKPVIGFETQREDFLGSYGSLGDPRAVIENQCNNSIARGWAPVGSHQIGLTLEPGQTERIVFVLGVAKQVGDEQPTVAKYQTDHHIQAELDKLKAYWETNLAAYQTSTPDEDLNTMVNIWNQYQCRTTFNWSRSASYYESGIGRGMGFRDSCQDVLGFVHMIPAEARVRLLDIASTQLEAGDAYHQYQPLTKKGAGGGFSDDHLWLILATAQYMKESGDTEVLKESVPYNCGDSGVSGSLYEHLDRALQFTMTHCGLYDLPLMLNADWNDCLNLNGDHKKAASVFTAMLFVYAAREMVRIAELMKDSTGKERYEKYIEVMCARINDYAWDGEWYRRGYTEDERPVGSKECREGGEIYLLPQAWAVMADVGSKERLVSGMDAVKERLATKHGLMLLQPGYRAFDNGLGSITMYPAGLKENGAIFCHPNPWAIIAEAILGRGDRAFEYYKAILPAAKNDESEIRKTEPYVYCQMIAGKEHTLFGEGKNSWLTGTAAWNFFAVSSYILGIRADYDGLIIDPAIPAHWDGFDVVRRFRETRYHIRVVNPAHVSKGVKTIVMDGVEIQGNKLPHLKDSKEHLVEVIMG